MSQTPSPHELYLLQQELRIQEDSLLNRDQYLKLREQLDHLIESERHYLYQIEKAHHSPKGESKENQIASKKQDIARLKKKKSEVDHRLDESEELCSSDIEALRQRISKIIIERHPGQTAVFTAIKEKITHYRDLNQKLEHLLKLNNDLALSLRRAVEEGLSVRRGGFLRYIMGMNPNLVVIACLTNMQTLCAQITVLLEDLPGDLQPSLTDAINAIDAKSREKWSWRTFASTYQQLLARLESEQEHLSDAYKKNKEHEEEAHRSYTTWLYTNHIS